MSKRQDLTGQKFNKITVISYNRYEKDTTFWNCICECGKELVVRARDLKRGHTKSCGCIRKGKNHRNTHNMSNTSLYGRWDKIKQRCNNVTNKQYKDYGGRGITICDEWNNSFESFMDWSINNGYNEKLTIDRIDNNKGYSPDNCRWVTLKIQQNNRRSNMYLKREGRVQSATAWAEELGLKADILRIVFNNSELLTMFERVD